MKTMYVREGGEMRLATRREIVQAANKVKASMEGSEAVQCSEVDLPPGKRKTQTSWSNGWARGAQPLFNEPGDDR